MNFEFILFVKREFLQVLAGMMLGFPLSLLFFMDQVWRENLFHGPGLQRKPVSWTRFWKKIFFMDQVWRETNTFKGYKRMCTQIYYYMYLLFLMGLVEWYFVEKFLWLINDHTFHSEHRWVNGEQPGQQVGRKMNYLDDNHYWSWVNCFTILKLQWFYILTNIICQKAFTVHCAEF